ncbi:MAG: Gfo/Idh/MocA family oxidoreductase [Ignavibacteriales bacterium]|nr:MAG: Gfo/Idh/MocA family oxidoreductase [Ignavibacteriales bacterium]
MLNIKKRSIKKVKWGVAGCGRFTELSILPAINLLPRSTVTSLFSADLSRAKSLSEKFGVNNYFNSYDEFLKSDIDSVYVASSNHLHKEQVIKAAQAGKNILCEKPMSLNSSEAEEMIKACEENKVLFSVGYVHRFHPLVTKAKEILKNQMLGKLVSIQLNFNIDFPPGSNFRFSMAKSGGGALRDLGTHMIDMLRYFGGEIEIINGVMDQVVYKSEVEDFSSAIVKFVKGGYGYFNVSYNNKKSFNRIEILGHTGSLSIESYIGVKLFPSKLTIMLDGEAKKSFRKRANKLYHQIKSVQNSFLKNETPLVTGYDGLINLKLMEELEAKCRTEKS